MLQILRGRELLDVNATVPLGRIINNYKATIIKQRFIIGFVLARDSTDLTSLVLSAQFLSNQYLNYLNHYIPLSVTFKGYFVFCEDSAAFLWRTGCDKF